jgi:hypothetical protein
MKTAQLLAIALLVGAAAIVAGATPAGAQSIPETPISPIPQAASPAVEPILTWSPTVPLTLLPALAGGPFAPLLPVWLPTLQRSPSQGWPAATRETGSNRATKERNRPGRIVSR